MPACLNVSARSALPLLTRNVLPRSLFTRCSLIGLLCGMVIALLAIPVALACPFCAAPSLSLAEQIAQADAAILAKVIGGRPPADSDVGTTLFEVVEVLRASGKVPVTAGDQFTLERYRTPAEETRYLVFGSATLEGSLEWASPLEASTALCDYVRLAPIPSEQTTDRLRFFLNYLEHSDTLVGDDAYAEFANAPYAAIVPLRSEFPLEKLRGWVVDPKIAPSRLGLYGLMLGLCGTTEDAQRMEAQITAQTDAFRLGIDGLMGGYLLLTGEAGLQVLEQTKLANKQAPFSETYSAMQAVRFLWQYEKDRVPLDRLRGSMRVLLDRPELADIVIADLARMEDWSVQDRLMEIYGQGDYDIPSIKRAIVRYMLASTKLKGAPNTAGTPNTGSASTTAGVAAATVVPTTGTADVTAPGEGAIPAEVPPHVLRGREYIAQLEIKDPKTVKDTRRYFLIR